MGYYSTILDKLDTLVQADPLANTLTHGNVGDIDLEKKNIYPLVHVDITGGNFTTGQTVELNVRLECVIARDINKHDTTRDKIYGQDNEVDNYNTTLSIINRIWKNLLIDLAGDDVTAKENPTLEKLSLEDKNLLDGWGLDFTLEIPDNVIALC